MTARMWAVAFPAAVAAMLALILGRFLTWRDGLRTRFGAGRPASAPPAGTPERAAPEGRM